jgi:hypothetical protein
MPVMVLITWVAVAKLARQKFDKVVGGWMKDRPAVSITF